VIYIYVVRQQCVFYGSSITVLLTAFLNINTEIAIDSTTLTLPATLNVKELVTLTTRKLETSIYNRTRISY